jgi:hypothetical protein
MRERMAGSFTLLSSKISAAALLDAGLAHIELPGLAIMIGEAFGPDALQICLPR